MKSKFFRREVKIGIMTIVAIFILYFGLNFLKGIDIFNPVSYYYAVYNNIGGLVPSAPVYIKGYKAGQVEEIKYDFMKEKSFLVKISMNKDINVPLGAEIELFDDGLMGGKAIQVVFKEYASEQKLYKSGDTIPSSIGAGLLAQLSGELVPKIESVVSEADSTLRALRKVMESKELSNSLVSIETTTGQLALSSKKLNSLLSNDFPKIISDVNVMTSDFKQISGNLKKIDFASTFEQVDYTIKNLNLITDKINKSEGSIGLLLNDKNLYLNLTNTASSADNLLIDLKNNPKRYVHFSLFGSKK